MELLNSIHEDKNDGTRKSIIICENVFTEDELNEIESRCMIHGEYIPSDDCNEHLVQTHPYGEINFFNRLTKFNVLPKDYYYHGLCHRIVQNEKGQIFPHVDHNKRFSISLYLNSVECGGELEFYLNDTVYTLSPNRGKVAIMTNNVLHWTKPVIKGQRRSVQFFVRNLVKVN